ncbi:hypothetical protein PPYR_02141 [Photinus pyralis]|uniref:Uncharacterized protein n=1 Tax=Photinus pyralis TaxID=7054 RepID=A0A5N4B6C7_PHOPY|nr:uncharacterized protein LOC116160402 [Photinus pyralis]XP_031342650.1 uncharacterized protein LOC116170414 [Photinus pyralis]KAB0797162.1 hypothetical protein PPYR_08156 [Photinus pyralis]KAB0805171.1 hypothetical protein PPYR_02141 [Photinus pyralis]
MCFIIVLFGTTLFTTIEPAQLPSYFPRCYQDDRNINECFINAANSLNQYVRSGIPEIGLRPLDPFVSPDLNLTIESPITDIAASAQRFTFYRLYNYRLNSAEVRPKDGAINGTVTLPDVGLSADYQVHGHIVNLPLSGSGDAKVEFGNIICDFLIDNWLEKFSCNEIKLEMSCKIEDVKMNLTGIPNEDATNTLINLSSKLVASELSPAYSNIFKLLFRPFLKRLCRKYPLDHLFPLSS